MLTIILVISHSLRQIGEYYLNLPANSLVSDALQLFEQLHADLYQAESASNSYILSCWGKKCLPDRTLQDGDRIELTRPLLRSPRESRARRFAKQGARKAGLFKKT